ncbi:hypothetical protein [Bradyrhizobium sp. ORS 285]|uniref:hypothetical protein n=1 Tax=Bradyrhizobium sp. ORS 285 TaxID=115808 RepID=UPI000555A31E|nr:hypothetical protein [Bradyrhizobium sp. ORS 285]
MVLVAMRAAVPRARDRVRARSDRVVRDPPRLSLNNDQERTMTAYLISLAVVGLVAMAAADALS